ncbi:MAG: thioredoxin [Mogibacterium sp.]|nr:thioredoxin [Mogibacterium sp.]
MESRKRLIIALLLLVLSVSLVTVGVMRGEVPVVFTKAVHICLECIGLG